MLAFMAIVVLKGCTLGLKTVTASKQQSQILDVAEETFGEDPPEELLAFRDDRHLNNQESYTKLLDELESQCFEGRKEIALLTLTSAEKYKKAGFNYSVLEILEDYVFLAESTNDMDSCKSIYVEVSKEYL